jgi:hypothetical protein
VNHIPTDASVDGSPQEFDLIAIPLNAGAPIGLVKNVGMFAYPVTSPSLRRTNFIRTDSGETLWQDAFSVAYLQAIFPDQSETSKYRLFVVDRDGSNPKGLFPEEGAPGLDAQEVVWSPTAMETNGHYTVAVIYNGNIWFIDSETGVAQQVTGDGLTSRVDWR